MSSIFPAILTPRVQAFLQKARPVAVTAIMTIATVALAILAVGFACAAVGGAGFMIYHSTTLGSMMWIPLFILLSIPVLAIGAGMTYLAGNGYFTLLKSKLDGA